MTTTWFTTPPPPVNSTTNSDTAGPFTAGAAYIADCRIVGIVAAGVHFVWSGDCWHSQGFGMKNNPVPFDENGIGASLALSVNDSTPGRFLACLADAHRMCRSRRADSADRESRTKSSVEFYFYSPNYSDGSITTLPSIVPAAGVPPLIFGIVDTSAGFNKYVGEDAHGVGYCPGDGKVYVNGSVIAAIQHCAVQFIRQNGIWIRSIAS